MMNANNARSQLAELTSSVLWPVTPAALHSELLSVKSLQRADSDFWSGGTICHPHRWHHAARQQASVTLNCWSASLRCIRMSFRLDKCGWNGLEAKRDDQNWRDLKELRTMEPTASCSQCTVAFCSCPAPLRAAEDQSYYSGWQERIRKGSLPRQRVTQSQPDDRKREGNTVRGWAPIRQGPQMDGGCDSYQEWIIMAGKAWSEGVNSNGGGATFTPRADDPRRSEAKLLPRQSINTTEHSCHPV